MKEALKKEAEVAFSKDAQPIWFRVLKYALFAALLYFLWGHRFLWPIVLGLIAASIALHLWFRHKTNVWTTPYGPWKPKPPSSPEA